MSNRTYPKDNMKRLKEVIRDLKAFLRQKDKEIKFLREELENLMKPVRDRKAQVEKPSYDEWKKDFVKRWKKDTQSE